MKRILWFLMLIFIISLELPIAHSGSIILWPSSPPAGFTCGPYLKTYRVTSPGGQLGGVRCVKFINDEQPSDTALVFAWYGEGKWGNTKYRHVGYSGVQRPSGKQVNYAADIYGNGEDTSGEFHNLVISTSSDRRIIRVTGEWDEVWTLMPNNVVQDYKSQLGPLDSCGAKFTRYIVTDADDQSIHGKGVRCRIGVWSFAWYGEGNWGSNMYAHLGVYVFQGIGASDICEPSKFSLCGEAEVGSLKITGSTECILPEKLRVQGVWNETWTNNPSTKVCID